MRRLPISCVFASALILQGCFGMVRESVEKATAEDLSKNKQTALAVGTRTFDVSTQMLMKACITAFANRNFSVTNLDKEMGFIIAEGGNPLSPEKEKAIMTERIERLNKESAYVTWTYMPGNYTARINMNLFAKGKDKTEAKMTFSMRVQPPNTPYSLGTYEAIPHELLVAWYAETWDEIEKALFIQRETVSD